MVFFLPTKNKNGEKHIARPIHLALFIFLVSFFIQKDQVYAQVQTTTDPFAGIRSVSDIQKQYSRLFDPNSPQYQMTKELQLRAIDNAQFPYSPDNTPISLSDYPLEVDKDKLNKLIHDPLRRDQYINDIKQSVMEIIKRGNLEQYGNINIHKEALNKVYQYLEEGLGMNVKYEQFPAVSNESYDDAGVLPGVGVFRAYSGYNWARDTKEISRAWTRYGTELKFNTDFYENNNDEKLVSLEVLGHELTHTFDFFNTSKYTEPILNASLLGYRKYQIDDDTFDKYVILILDQKSEYNAYTEQASLVRDLLTKYPGNKGLEDYYNDMAQRSTKFSAAYQRNLNILENTLFNLPEGSLSYIDLINNKGPNADNTLLTSAGTEISFPGGGVVDMKTTDGVETKIYKDGSKVTTYDKGTIVAENSDGNIIIVSPEGVVSEVSAASLARDKAAIEEEQAASQEKADQAANYAQQQADTVLQYGSASHLSGSGGGVKNTSNANNINDKTQPGQATGKNYDEFLLKTGTYQVGEKVYQSANPQMIVDPQTKQLKINPDYKPENDSAGPRMVKDPTDETKEIVKPGVDIPKECPASCSIDKDGVLHVVDPADPANDHDILL